MFSHLVGCLFTLLMVSLVFESFWLLIPFVYFCFYFLCFRSWIKKKTNNSAMICVKDCSDYELQTTHTTEDNESVWSIASWVDSSVWCVQMSPSLKILNTAHPAVVSPLTYLAWLFLLGPDELSCVGVQCVHTEY